MKLAIQVLKDARSRTQIYLDADNQWAYRLVMEGHGPGLELLTRISDRRDLLDELDDAIEALEETA